MNIIHQDILDISTNKFDKSLIDTSEISNSISSFMLPGGVENVCS